MKLYPILLLILSLAIPLSSVAAPCLHYLGEPVTLSGKVTFRTFYGPPNYGENPDTDSRETQAILLLVKPICVEANPRDYDGAEQNQLEVTLVPLHKENLRHYVGKRITVHGLLFHANTGHHHTPVLLQIDRIGVLRTPTQPAYPSDPGNLRK